MKMQSIPESEPLHTIIQSRIVNLSSIKDKGERSYWRKLKQQNRIPDLYLPIVRRKEEQIDFKRLGNI